MNTRTNAGYQIIVSVPLNSQEEAVIGKSSSGYVVWTCRDGDNYFWGHYVTSYTQALKGLIQKIDQAL